MKKLAVALMILVSLATSVVIAGDQGLNSFKMQGYKALKVFVQLRDEQITTADFLEYQTTHFTLKYRPQDEDVIREIAGMFEQSYDEATKVFGHAADNKTVVIIYKDQNEFWEYQDSIQGQAVMGLYNMGIIHILSPKAYTNQKQSPMEYFKSNGPVLHEYTHKAADEITGGNLELWLTEGLALYMEKEVTHTEWAPGFQYMRYFDSYEMREGFMYIDEVQAYKQSYDMVSYLIDSYGMEHMQLLLRELGSGSTTDQSFMNIYGFTADEFIDAKEYVK